MKRLMAGAAAAAALACAAPASAAVNRCNVAIPVSDGQTMRANVSLPGDGTGRHPAIITVTGYNKDLGNPTGTQCAGDAFVDAGYARVVIDDRGTGASGGRWDVWSERTQLDYEEELDWLAEQPWFDGRAGVTGGSYLGITALFVAQADARRVAEGKDRVVEAVWADVPMADAYRDVTFHGGALDAGFMPLWLGLVNGLSAVPPSSTSSDPAGALPIWADHLEANATFAGTRIAEAALGADSAFDSDWFRTRSPITRIESLEIPVAWTGGWWDIFQRGEPLLYERMVNARERKLWMTPTYHVGGQDVWDRQGIGPRAEVVRRWFDRWVKGERNGVEDLPDVNLWTMGAERWQHPSDWPLEGTRYTRLYADAGKALVAARPAGGADSTPLLPASSPCSRLTAQWTAGFAGGPCETDNRTFEATALTYTTPALTRDTEVTGPIVADVWATLDRASDATLVAVLSDVAPSGESTQVTAGFLMASQRAIDRRKSDHAKDGTLIRPHHPFTREAAKPVEPGLPTRYAIEVYPTSHVFKEGHRLRLTLATANTPSTATPLPALARSAGGTLRLLRGGRYGSHVLLPIQGDHGVAKSAKRRAKRKRR